MSVEPELNRLKQQLERSRRELSSYKVAAAQVGNQLAEISRLNQEISRSRREIDLILKTTSDAMRLVDRDFNVIWVNAAMEQFCGSDSTTLKKEKCYDVIRSIKCETDNCLLTRVLKENRQINEEVTIDVNGAEKEAITVASPFYNEEGDIIGILEDFIDITKRKKYEGELLKMQKLESVGVLAGGIAHDFNNLLTAIVANISLVKERLNPDDPHRKMLTEAEKACFLSKDLTQQLLTFSRGGKPVKEVIYLQELIEESTRFSLRGSNVTCAFSFAPDLWPVMVDPGQLSQVINNLIINADQAMPEGGRIMVGAENIVLKTGEKPPLSEGNYIKIFVDDEGMGIPGETLSKIFDPFFSTKSDGSGLGLAISYSIVNNHGGHIIAKSRDEKGTSFSIFLPATRIKLIEKDSPRQICSPGAGRILVMDDEELVTGITCRTLTHFGYQAEHVPDGESAIKYYIKAREEGRPYVAVIMDLTIPGRMGGKEALLKLKELDPDVRTIVSSGYSTDPIMANYREYGFSGVLPKPYRLDDLRNVLQSVIGDSDL